MTDDARLGELIEQDGRTGLRFVRDLRHPPARVWRALTESDQLRTWMPADIVGERRAGAAITARFWPEVADKYAIADVELPGEILEWDPPHRFSWRWDTDTLLFELTATEQGTHLVFTTWIGGGPAINMVAAGYHVCFDQLRRLVDDGAAPPFTEQDPTPYELRYAETFGLDGTTAPTTP